jgi:hypothetical protein
MRIAITAAVSAALLVGSAAPAQVRTIDPNAPVDGDLRAGQRRQPAPRVEEQPVDPGDQSPYAEPQDAGAPPPVAPPPTNERYTAPRAERRADATTQAAETFKRDDLISAGEGVFGKGAAGLGGMIERILKDQGEPNAYIAGREAAGAFVVGVRYGSGIMTHKVEGQQPVYWTGPSVGFDVGGDANKVFVLVYNLYDTEELYRRFPAAEGRLYLVGGFAATYLRRGNIVLIPVRLGVGWRAGVNVGYMNFTHKSRWLPF